MEHHLSYEEAELYCRTKCKLNGSDFDKKTGIMELDYASTCYRSALKGYKAVLKSMEEDNHSVMSDSITRGILAKLTLAQIDDDRKVYEGDNFLIKTYRNMTDLQIYKFVHNKENVKQAEWIEESDHEQHLRIWIEPTALKEFCNLLGYSFFDGEFDVTLCYDGSIFIGEFDILLDWFGIEAEEIIAKGETI